MVEHHPALIPTHAVAQVQHGVFTLTELHTLMHGIQKPVRPKFRIDALSVADAA